MGSYPATVREAGAAVLFGMDCTNGLANGGNELPCFCIGLHKWPYKLPCSLVGADGCRPDHLKAPVCIRGRGFGEK
eukprot:1160747-Pelagomonas_calceolata.AAC.1